MVAQRRAGCEHAVIAMAMYSGRWHQGGDPVDDLQRTERQFGGAVGLWLGQMIVRQAKLGASCRVKVPVGRAIRKIVRKG